MDEPRKKSAITRSRFSQVETDYWDNKPSILLYGSPPVEPQAQTENFRQGRTISYFHVLDWGCGVVLHRRYNQEGNWIVTPAKQLLQPIHPHLHIHDSRIRGL
ncbi:hypothetical protein DTO021C3_8033 [Paecilomyces variotii]|nr:hypothetical protein DTO021C3_8033 [Paecilomyces variotii]KAJ9396110.1 hypothetical protein DTO282F9_6953 [Paecilomyces variotii]